LDESGQARPNDEPMKVLIVSQHFWPENFRVNDFATELVARGNKVTVLTGLPNYPKGSLFPGFSFLRGPYRETWRGVEIVRTPIVTRGNKKSIRLILNYLSFAIVASFVALFRLSKSYDRIFVYQTSPVFAGFPAIVLKIFRGTPVYFWILDLWPDTLVSLGILRGGGGPVRLLNSVVQWMYKKCDKILVPSFQIRNRLLSEGVSSEKVDYFPQWAEDVFLCKEFEAKDEDIVKSIMPQQGFRILFSGNIGVAQDFRTILDAAFLLKGRPDIQFVVVGDGHHKKFLEQEVVRMGLENQFTLPGSFPLEYMPIFYKYSDALFVSLKKDPLFEMTVPSKVQAYMASGRPIIAALDGEGAEIIERAGCGFVAGSGNAEKMAECILRVQALSPRAREAMGEDGLRYYTENFLKKKVIQQFLSMEPN